MPTQTASRGNAPQAFGSNTVITVLLSCLGAFGAGLGGYSTYQGAQVAVNPEARADAWTGTKAKQQADILRLEMQTLCAKQTRKTTSIQGDFDALSSKVERRLDFVDTEVARLHGQLKQLSWQSNYARPYSPPNQ